MNKPYNGQFHIELLNPNYGCAVRVTETIARLRTEYQDLEVVDTPMFGRMLLLDKVMMTTERDEFFYHENLIHVGGLAHPGPRSALVVGGGDGGSSEELLKYSTMQRVVMAELDRGVVEASKQYLQKVHRGAFDDPRLTVMIGDGKAFVERTDQRFDIVALDLTDPLGPSVQLYTREFYEACKRILNPGGVLTLHVESPITRPQAYQRIVATLKAVFPIVRPYMVYVPIYCAWWGMATASETVDPLALSEAEVERRIAERGIGDLQYLNGAVYRAMLSLPNFVRALLAEPAAVITTDSLLVDEVGDPTFKYDLVARK
ncbi:polyamine aminopropyltransferase [Pelomicrobium methylotrophicum]|uniref:Polyamine aminopropyltransferase n=1 Tax=Pelomicrobium methylotrophicum TaxID=2602750 RepID=A0A5C7ERU8_9PROT|nr:polyamine aminopropyltransferase [Pelomicrobium methylotrophicum]TXF11382.1 polyamine aminopropyltransferase [Pelomicrobium methylotrophicum]